MIASRVGARAGNPVHAPRWDPLAAVEALRVNALRLDPLAAIQADVDAANLHQIVANLDELVAAVVSPPAASVAGPLNAPHLDHLAASALEHQGVFNTLNMPEVVANLDELCRRSRGG